MIVVVDWRIRTGSVRRSQYTQFPIDALGYCGSHALRFAYDAGMSIPVAIPDLADALEGYGWAYLLTVSDDQRPHTVAVSPTWSGEVLVMGAGRRSTANASARPDITLCYPPLEADGYSLIVDGTASVDGDGAVAFAPSTAVLHRPAPSGFEGSPTGCASDCLPLS